MNAHTSIRDPLGDENFLPARPYFALDPEECRDVRASLIKARDIALANRGSLPEGPARQINALMADIANDAAWTQGAPLMWLRDALQLCRLMMRAQSQAGTLDGTYSTDRYDNENRGRDGR